MIFDHSLCFSNTHIFILGHLLFRIGISVSWAYKLYVWDREIGVCQDAFNCMKHISLSKSPLRSGKGRSKYWLIYLKSLRSCKIVASDKTSPGLKDMRSTWFLAHHFPALLLAALAPSSGLSLWFKDGCQQRLKPLASTFANLSSKAVFVPVVPSQRFKVTPVRCDVYMACASPQHHRGQEDTTWLFT